MVWQFLFSSEIARCNFACSVDDICAFFFLKKKGSKFIILLGNKLLISETPHVDLDAYIHFEFVENRPQTCLWHTNLVSVTPIEGSISALC